METSELDWKVSVPEWDSSGVLIERFEVTQEQENFDKLRAALNPQRPDRSVVAGIYTKLVVDGTLWMTDTPAECNDLRNVDYCMRQYQGGTMLIAGLGLGVVLNRAIMRGMSHIDVVESEGRVLDAVGPYYAGLAEEHGCKLRLHHADIHAWRSERGMVWNIGFFDIWPTIDQDDLPEVTRLRRRFRDRVHSFDAWAQMDRLLSKQRVRNGTGFY